MTVRCYYSTDASAPTLNGAVGSLIAVLDACLINGYGSKAGSGWAKSFTGTNKAVYRAPSGNRHYLRVDDTGGSGANYARVRCFETMSDVDTGTGPTPTDTQISGGCYQFKSTSASSTTSHWMVVATQQQFYLIVVIGNTTMEARNASNAALFFGDITSFKASDIYHTLLLAGNSAASDGGSYMGQAAALNVNLLGHYLVRSYTQIGSSITAGKQMDTARGAAGQTATAYPDPVTGGILLAPVYISEASAVVTRGLLPGLWSHLHPSASTSVGQALATFDGTGDLVGKTFQFVDVGEGSVFRRMVMEISDTW